MLLRAIEPKFGIDAMRQWRATSDIRFLCAGPGRLSQALQVTASLDGLSVMQLPFKLAQGQAADVAIGRRIGISRAKEELWRFGLKESRFLSRKF